MRTTEMRKTGVDVVGDMPWGTHFCLFYETTEDLLETTVSYCKAGLENQEFCLWVVAEPLTLEEATCALRQAVPDFDRYFSDHSIEIVAARDWYLQNGTFDLNRVIRGWNEKLARASARGYAGVRVTGDTAWLEKKDWKDFCEYEESLNQAVANQRLAVLCTYPLAACGAGEILDVVRTHQFAVTKRRGEWDVIETAGHKQAKAEIRRLNEELEQRVAERTSQLTAVNNELTKEVLQRQRAEKALLRSEAYLAEAQRVSHTGSFGWNVSSGDIVWSDETFRIFGYDPARNPTVEAIVERTHPEDRVLAQETIDQAARNRKAFDVEHRLLMPDGTVKYLRVVGHPSTKDESGNFEFVGAVTDISESKRAEESLRRSEGYLAEAQRLSHTGSFAGAPGTGEIRYWSEECYRALGFDPQKGLPRFETFFQRIHPHDQARTVEQLERASREKTEFEFDYRILHPSGEIRDIHTVGHPVFNQSGDLVEFVGTVIDVTAAKRAEKTLRESEAYLAEAQRLSHTGSGAWHVPGWDAVYLSDEWYRIYGFDPKQGLSAWNDRLQRMHPEDRAKVQETKDRAINEKTDYEVDHRIVLPDGTVKYTHTVGHPVLNASGEVEQFVCTMMDVTERRHAEEALLRSEAYLAEAQKLSHTGSWACKIATREMIHSSEEHRRLFGLDPEREGIPLFDEFYQRIHPEDRDRTVDDLEKAIRAGTNVEAHFRVVLPEGTTRYMYGIGHPVVKLSGNPGEFVGTVMDVTERTRAVALRDGERRTLEMIARDAPLEEILEKLVRVVEAQFTGLLCSVLLLDNDGQHVRHGAAPSLPKSYIDAIDGSAIGPKAGSCGTAMYRREAVIVTDILQDPLWEPYREVAEPYGFRACWSTPILAHSGKALGSFAMYYRDPRSPSPAETRALEMATHLAGIAIERKLAREERERLRQAQSDLAHINRVTTMGELTASLAHEIKQPITAAVTDARTCLRWLGRDKPDVSGAREAASRLVTDVTRAAEIISRIGLLFNKGAVRRELVDVNELIQEMIVLLRSEAARYSISIRSSLAHDLSRIMADRVQLQQVFMNLMLNGIEAMKDIGTGGELTINSEEGDSSQVLISVGDTGVGLQPEHVEQVFNAFYTTKAGGTGMGLAISRSIIESHGGRLWANPNSGRGATFQFTLPIEGIGQEAA